VIGVSPAYFISRYSNRFTPAEVAEGLMAISELGYQGFQLEVFHRDNLGLWVEEGARLVRERSKDLGLIVTQFVAHFMMKAFEGPENLRSDWGDDDMKAVLEIVNQFDECRIITIPLGPFETPAVPSPAAYRSYLDHFINRIARLLEMVEESGQRLALEILPSALIGGTEGFLRLCEQVGTETLGLNFDTGHAWASKENLYLIPAKLGKRIAGTHLCDNFGHENLSLRPGTGSIDWPRLVRALQVSGYTGSYDLEIICGPEEVPKEYADGRTFMEAVFKRLRSQKHIQQEEDLPC
jgi:sugar phosphate isomerase/epimerase